MNVSIPEKTNKSSDQVWNVIAAWGSALAAIGSFVFSMIEHNKRKPKLDISVHKPTEGSSTASVEIINHGFSRGFVKITQFVVRDGQYIGKYFRKAWFSEISERCIETNRRRNKNASDNLVHDYLYEIDSYEPIAFYVPRDEYDELEKENGGFFIRDTSGSYYICTTEKVKKLNKRQADRLFKQKKKKD